MSVVVQMSIAPPDPTAFRSACEWLAGKDRPSGMRAAQVLADENGSGRMCLLQEWDDHDSFHSYTEKIGDEFNQRAGTVGLDWVTNVWSTTDIPTP